jgi:hypothetical protein
VTAYVEAPSSSRRRPFTIRSTCLQSTKHVASSQDQKTDQQEREPAVHNRDAEMGVVNNCGDQGNNDRDTESDDLGC